MAFSALAFVFQVSCLTTVSQFYAQSLSSLRGRRGRVISPFGEFAAASIWNGENDADQFVTTHDPLVVQVIGLQNTGTNLMETAVEMNFPGRAVLTSDVGGGMWKHSNINFTWQTNEGAEIIRQEFQEKHIRTIATVRDPLSWLVSMRKAPYDMMPCLSATGFSLPYVVREDWLTHECYCTCPTAVPAPLVSYPELDDADVQHCLPKFNRTMSSLVEVWNQWNAAYSASSEFGFPELLIVRYEDMVLTPEPVLQRVADYLDLPLPATALVPEDAAKSHGDPNGRAAAMEKIRQRTFLSGYQDGDVEGICSRLDERVLMRFDYRDSCENSGQ
eukprot:TRINITY_DN8424_c0_g1_i7.p1 TRINITY_DN8424_c0_g1~~TRINITY_DN8424_c0_g1_i7.p1  ORF type:complete len:331 (+),score=58.52 TRINITY_DN8424_c0_g1_i7:74-1066(+)